MHSGLDDEDDAAAEEENLRTACARSRPGVREKNRSGFFMECSAMDSAGLWLPYNSHGSATAGPFLDTDASQRVFDTSQGSSEKTLHA